MNDPAKPPPYVAFQGEEGSNSHIASHNRLPEMAPSPQAMFEDVFVALAERRVAAALVPFENSVIGRIADVHRLLPQYDLLVTGEYFFPVTHHLLGLPGASIDTLRRVYSQPPALNQCRTMIRSLGLTMVPTADTAGAARDVARHRDPESAVIATKLAAKLYGLKILRSNIEDNSCNITRFLILSHRDDVVIPHPETSNVVTAFLFRVRNVPAALYKALGGFATNGVNMTKLESSPLEGSFEATRFFAEITDHPDRPGPARAFDELRYFASDVRILGIYPQHPARHKANGLSSLSHYDIPPLSSIENALTPHLKADNPPS